MKYDDKNSKETTLQAAYAWAAKQLGLKSVKEAEIDTGVRKSVLPKTIVPEVGLDDRLFTD